MAENAFKADWPSFALGFNTGKSKGGGGTPEGFHKVQFFNDDRTTLLYTVLVPDGANAMYAGETPVSTVDDMYELTGFDPVPKNVMSDLDCYAVYEYFKALDSTSWNKISQLSAEGRAQNYFAVGDTKIIHVEGKIGTLSVSGDYGVYILGFDHNETLEGNGIHFGTFKTKEGKDVALVDSSYDKEMSDGEKWFNVFHAGGTNNYGGWSGCDMRYDILGSTDVAPSSYGEAPVSGRVGYDATLTCATNPVPNTLMAALPADLRAVMKPMTKYSDNAGGETASVSATIDYLPLLAAREVLSRPIVGREPSSVVKMYQYFSDGNGTRKYKHSSTGSYAHWWLRSAHYYSSKGTFSVIDSSMNKTCFHSLVGKSYGLAPIFKV